MTQLETIEQHLLDAVKAIRTQRKKGGSRATLYKEIAGTCHAVLARCEAGDTEVVEKGSLTDAMKAEHSGPYRTPWQRHKDAQKKA